MYGTVLSTVDYFYCFTKKFNDDAARVNNTNEPPIHACLLKRDTVECTIKDFLMYRWDQLSGKISVFFSVSTMKQLFQGRIKVSAHSIILIQAMAALFNVVEHQIILVFMYLLFRVTIWTKKNSLLYHKSTH